MDASTICSTMQLGDLLQSGSVFEWTPGTLGSSSWRSQPRLAVLGRHGFVLIRTDSGTSASVIFRCSSLDTLRVTDLLADPRALTAGALNAFELRIEHAPDSAAPSPSNPIRICIIAGDADAKSQWLATLFEVLSSAAPPETQLEKAWVHSLLQGTLHSAAAANDFDAVRALARFGPAGLEATPLPQNIDVPPYVDVNATDADAATPLHIAATLGHSDAVSALLEAGADVHATNLDGDTPLHCAIAAGSAAAALILIVNGSPQDTRSLLGATPLAALLSLSSLLDARDDTGESAKEMRGIAEALLSHGAPSRDIDGEGFTPAHRVAMLFGSKSLVKALSRKNTDWNSRALLSRPDMVQDSLTPLHIACGAPFAGDPRLPPEFDLSDKVGDTSASGSIGTITSVRRVAVGVIGSLVHYGAAPNSRTEATGETPLHLLLRAALALRRTQAAGTDGPSEAVGELTAAAQLIAGAGGRMDIADARGVTVLSLAEAAGVNAALAAARAQWLTRPSVPAPRDPPPFITPLPLVMKKEMGGKALAVEVGGKALATMTAFFGALKATAESGNMGPAPVFCGACGVSTRRINTCVSCSMSACEMCTAQALAQPHCGSAGGVDSDDDEASPSSTGARMLTSLRKVLKMPGGVGGDINWTSRGGPVCEGCFNRAAALAELATAEATAWRAEKAAALVYARNFAEANPPAPVTSRGGSLATFTGRPSTEKSSKGLGTAPPASISEGAARDELMAAAKKRAMARAAANGGEEGGRAAKGFGGVSGALEGLGAMLQGNKDKLVERGEKIERLDDHSEQLADDAKEFSSLADQLKNKMKNRWF